MTRPQPQSTRVMEAFLEALDLLPKERAKLFEELQAESPELRRDVEELLAYEDRFRERGEAQPRSIRAGMPDSLGPYRLLNFLGEGGQGKVYSAEDERIGRLVALKMIPSSSVTSNTKFLERLRREALIGSSVEHPALCTVYEASEDAGFYFIAMRLVRGKPLSEFLTAATVRSSRKSPTAALQLPWRTGSTIASTWIDVEQADPHERPLIHLLRVFEEVALALHTAHEANVVHRDVKPANIMITEDGRPVLLDFGIASSLNDYGTRLTRTGEVFGTPIYMAPEQISGNRLAISPQSDIYSLGVTLYECLTGHPPFKANSTLSLMHAVLHTKPVPLRKARPELTQAWWNIVGSMLTKKPVKRYATCLQVVEALRRLRTSQPLIVKAGRTRKRMRFKIAPIAAVILVALFWLVDSTADSASKTAYRASINLLLREMGVLATEAKALPDVHRTRVSDVGALRSWMRRAQEHKRHLKSPIEDQRFVDFNAQFSRVAKLLGWLDKARVVELESPVSAIVSLGADLDEDGVDELVVSRSDAQPACVLSGGSGANLYSIDAPTDARKWTAKDAGLDVDSDNVPDVLFLSGTSAGSSRVHAISGATGQEIYSLGEYPEDVMISVAITEDLDRDRVLDWLIAGSSSKTLEYRSGATGSLIRRLTGNQFRSAGRVFHRVRVVADFDGDGMRDIVASQYGKGNYRRAISSATDEVIYEREWTSRQGGLAQSIGDINGDGVTDFAMGTPNKRTGGGSSTHFCSGKDGSTVRAIPVRSDEYSAGHAVASYETPGDGRVVIVKGRYDGPGKIRPEERMFLRFLSAQDGSHLLTVSGCIGISVCVLQDRRRPGAASVVLALRSEAKSPMQLVFLDRN